MDEQARGQLEILREIDEILAGLRVRFWLRGGWGVDFILGQITRPHADLDLVVWQRHRGRVQEALAGAGFRLDRALAVQSDFVKDGQDITIVFVERKQDGTIVARGIPDWIWRPDALPARRHCLHGICARVVAPEQMLCDHEGYEAATGRPPRPKDAETVRTLREIISRQHQHKPR